MSVKEIKYPKADKLLKELMRGSRVDAGYFEGMVSSDGFALPDIAFVNEVGTAKIPPRPFMSRALENAEKEIVTFARNEMSKPDYTAERLFKRLGLFLVLKIKEQIQTSRAWAEKNADATIKAKTRAGKKGDQPLVDDGTLLKSPDFKYLHQQTFGRLFQ